MGSSQSADEPEIVKDISTIIEGKVYLSGVGPLVEAAEYLRVTMGFTAILSATGREMDPLTLKFPSRLHFQVQDNASTDLGMVFQEAINFIQQSSENEHAKVLVHCEAGRSRSVSLILAYLMATQEDKTVEELYEFVLHQRSVIKPNVGFLWQVIQFGFKLRQDEDALQRDRLFLAKYMVQLCNLDQVVSGDFDAVLDALEECEYHSGRAIILLYDRLKSKAAAAHDRSTEQKAFVVDNC